MSLFKSDMNIAKLYVDSLLEKENLLFKNLLKEAKLSEQMILKIKNAPSLLQDNQVLKKTSNKKCLLRSTFNNTNNTNEKASDK